MDFSSFESGSFHCHFMGYWDENVKMSSQQYSVRTCYTGWQTLKWQQRLSVTVIKTQFRTQESQEQPACHLLKWARSLKHDRQIDRGTDRWIDRWWRSDHNVPASLWHCRWHKTHVPEKQAKEWTQAIPTFSLQHGLRELEKCLLIQSPNSPNICHSQKTWGYSAIISTKNNRGK